MKHILRAMMLAALIACDKPSGAARETEKVREKETATSSTHSDEPEHEGIASKVRLSEKVLKDANVRIAPVTKERLAVTLSLPGELSADPDKSARVSSPVSGQLSEVLFKEGTQVRKGAPLARLRIPDLSKLRAGHAATAARAASARSNAVRVGELAAKGLAAPQESISANAEANALEAEAKAMQSQMSSLGLGQAGEGSELVLRAPISGVVVARDAVVGQPVSTGDTIARIADLKEVWFLARVFEKDLEHVRAGALCEVQLNAFPRQRFAGSVEYVGRQIDVVARTVTARIRLRNTGDVLSLGLFGIAHLSVGENQDTPKLVVARNAVVEIGGKRVVFVRHADGDFEPHEVTLGEAGLGKIEVVTGLREGEQVVVEGAFTLKSAVLRSSFGETD